MKRTSMYTAVLALSLAMALAGGGLACRTFRERLDALEEQAVLQHQRNVCGLEDAFAAEYDTRSGAGYPSSGADSVCARVGQAYTRGQWLILGSSTAAFALMREGDVAYSALPESVAAADVQQAAAATDGILLCGETLLLGGVLNTPYSYPVAVVTAADASEAFAARNRLLYSWLAVQAVITLAALVAAYHYERLQELNARQSRFVADLTHELKTPLMAIQGYAEGIQAGVMDTGSAAEVILEESDRMTELVEELLDISKIDMGRQQLALSEMDIRELLYDSIRAVESAAAASGITIAPDFSEEPIMVKCDDTQMRRAVTNILTNGLRYARSELRLTCRADRRQVTIRIQDDGDGIAEADLPHIFDRFYMGRSGKSGIGLALTREIIHLHKGTIRARNGDTGAVFEISIPVSR